MPKKHPATRRFGGPGASHETRGKPAKSKARGTRSVSKPPHGNLKRGVGPPPLPRSLDTGPSASVSATRPGKRARPDAIVAGIRPKRGPARARSAARPQSRRRKQPRSR